MIPLIVNLFLWRRLEVSSAYGQTMSTSVAALVRITPSLENMRFYI